MGAWASSQTASGVLAGTVLNRAALPPAAENKGKMYYALEGSGGWFALVGVYKYPSGFYISDGSTWSKTPIQVQVSEDAETLVNIDNWTDFLSTEPTIKADDILVYDSILYKNKTGSTSATAPDTDTTNWGSASESIVSNTYHGVVTLPTLTDNGDGTVSITSGIVCFGTVANGDAVKVRLATPATSNISFTDMQVNYVYANYNSGTPTILVGLSPSIFLSDARLVPLFRIIREGTSLHVLDYDAYGIGLADKAFFKDVSLRAFERQSGLALSTAATRISTITAGSAWFGVQLYSLAENKAGTTGELYEYYLVSGVWNESLVTAYDSTYYSDGTNRQSLGVSKWVAKYFYRGIESDNHTYYTHGAQKNSLSDALAEAVPMAPLTITAHSLYVGKIVVQQGATNGTAYARTWGESISTAGATSHEDLSNILQAGTGVTNGHISNGVQTIVGAKTFTNGIIAETLQSIGDTYRESSSFDIPVFAIGTRKRIYNTGSSAITVTLPAGETIDGAGSFTLSAGYMVEVEKTLSAVWKYSSIAVNNTNAEIKGFTQLGELSPKLKVKIVTGTISSSINTEVSVSHGLSISKIVSFSILSYATDGRLYNTAEGTGLSSNYTLYSWLNASNVVVRTGPESAFLLGQPFTCFITYIE